VILEDCFSIDDASNGTHTLTLDSGATKTMVGRSLKNLVENAEKMEKPSRIHFPKGQSAISDKSGTLKIEAITSDGDDIKLSFKNTLIADDLKHSVASVAQVCDAGALVLFTKKDGKILRKDKNGKLYEVAMFPRCGNLYQLRVNEVIDQGNSQNNAESIAFAANQQ
jgi:hypothetical protein